MVSYQGGLKQGVLCNQGGLKRGVVSHQSGLSPGCPLTAYKYKQLGLTQDGVQSHKFPVIFLLDRCDLSEQRLLPLPPNPMKKNQV